ncbi:MAG: hypothetical protein MRERC_2c160 [Mycoplasmataceae bacterium RC_NB112A]|nr:MAG: hypothetical protein MRERC_2c160 [Mycoplasmataceae bacterium RC_NB112A]
MAAKDKVIQLVAIDKELYSFLERVLSQKRKAKQEWKKFW